MASTNKTPNLELSQWDLSDKPEMADFNNDFSKIDTVVATHLAESASKHITESGSNENGYYIKFDDGTMICWGVIDLGSIVYAGSGTFNDLYRTATKNQNFPKPFIEKPKYKTDIELVNDAGSATSRAIIAVVRDFDSDRFISVQAFRVSGESHDFDVRVHYEAKGRWK